MDLFPVQDLQFSGFTVDQFNIPGNNGQSDDLGVFFLSFPCEIIGCIDFPFRFVCSGSGLHQLIIRNGF